MLLDNWQRREATKAAPEPSHRPEPASGPLFATALSAPPPTRTFEALRPPAPPPPPRSEERTQPLPPRHLWDDPPRRDDDEDDPPRGLWSGWAR